MEMIYGKLNRDTILAEYKGISTKTASVNVDNNNYTISVDVFANGNQQDINALLYDKNQYLSDAQINQLYTNLKLSDYLNNNVVLLNKNHQVITSDIVVNGKLGTANKYIEVNTNGTPLKENEAEGIVFRGWRTGLNAKISLDNNGRLIFDNDITKEDIVLGTDLKYNKFTYWNGQSISSRDILPSDINTQEYEPTQLKDLTTKQYVDKSMRKNMNYAIVENNEGFGRLQAWEGRRALILEEARG